MRHSVPVVYYACPIGSCPRRLFRISNTIDGDNTQGQVTRKRMARAFRLSKDNCLALLITLLQSLALENSYRAVSRLRVRLEQLICD